MDDKANRGDGENQGEGDYRLGHAYDEHQRQFDESGKMEKAAKDAEKAIDGKEGAELRRAEEEGKRHSHGEDPQLRKAKH